MADKDAFARAVEAEIKLAEADFKRYVNREIDEFLSALFAVPPVGLEPLIRTCTFCDEPPADETSRCAEHMDAPCSHCGDPCCSYDEDC
jgi:hypothetical protein